MSKILITNSAKFMEYVQINNIPSKKYLTKMILRENLPCTILLNIIPPLLIESGSQYWVYFLLCSILFLFIPSQQIRNIVDYRIKVHNKMITVYSYSYFCKKKKTLPLNKVGVEVCLEGNNNYILIRKKGNSLSPTLSGFHWNKDNNSLCTKQNIIDMAEMLERYKDEMLYFRRR